MNNLSIELISISILTSVVGSIITAYYLKFRKKRLEKKISNIDEYEQFLEKLSKGNIRLLRSTFFMILVILGCVSFSLLTFLVTTWLNLPSPLKSILIGSSIGLLIGSVGLCFSHAKAIIQSSNLEETRENLQLEKEKILSKIN